MSSRPQPVEPMPSSSSMAPVNGLPQLSSLNMPPGSRTDSPSSNSTRTHSLSPSTMAAALNSNGQPQPVVNVDSGSWEDNLFGARDRSDVQPSPISTSYPVTPVSSTASQPSYQYPNPVASGSRAAVNQQYALSLPQNYTHSSDRPMGDSYTDSLFDRRFPFPQSPFQTSHDSAQPQLHAQSPTSAVSMPPQRGNANMQPPVNYAHRRSITEPQTLRSVLLNQVPAMAHLQQHSPVSAPRGTPTQKATTDGSGQLQTAEFDLNSRGGRMPSLPS